MFPPLINLKKLANLKLRVWKQILDLCNLGKDAEAHGNFAESLELEVVLYLLNMPVSLCRLREPWNVQAPAGEGLGYVRSSLCVARFFHNSCR